MSERVDLDRVAALDEAGSTGDWIQNGANGVHNRRGGCIATTHHGGQRTLDAELIVFYRSAAPAMARALKRIGVVTSAPISDLADANHMRNEVLRALAVLDATGGDDG